MNMTVTESDKKLLSFLAAFLIAIFFIFFAFRPLARNIMVQKKEIAEVKTQKEQQDKTAALSGQMNISEEEMKAQMNKFIQRFYPMMKSHEAENMVTILALNHDLEVQDLSILMPEKKSSLKWYQYAAEASDEIQAASEEEEDSLYDFGVYTARITCTASGEEKDMLLLMDDISENYPAISILSAEWTGREQIPVRKTVSVVQNVSDEEETGEDALDEENPEENEEAQKSEALTVQDQETVKTVGNLTLTLEIYMCEQ